MKNAMIRERALQFKFTPMPHPILFAEGISRDAKIVYLIILSFIWGKNDSACWPAQSKLCKLANMKDDTLRKYLKELKEKKLIDWKQKGLGKTNLYWICEFPEELIKSLEPTELQEPEPGGLRVLEPGGLRDKVDNRKYNKRLSKDIDNLKSDSDESQTIINNPLIDYWNALPNTQKHSSPKTKTYRRSCILLKQLKQGIFTKRNHINPDFLKRNKIPNKLLNKKWNNADLKIVMERLSNLLTGGYWPADKSNLPRSLELLLYNTNSNSSLFLMVAANKPEPLRKRQRMSDPNPGLTKEFSNLLNGNIDNPRKLYDGIQSIIDFHSKIPKDDERAYRRFDYPVKLCRAYAKWLEDRDWIKDITVGHISARTKTWLMFIKETEENFDIKLS